MAHSDIVHSEINVSFLSAHPGHSLDAVSGEVIMNGWRSPGQFYHY